MNLATHTTTPRGLVGVGARLGGSGRARSLACAGSGESDELHHAFRAPVDRHTVKPRRTYTHSLRYAYALHFPGPSIPGLCGPMDLASSW